MAPTSWLPSVLRFAIITAPSYVVSWIAANPGQKALLIVAGFIIFTPGALTVPLLASMGFGAQGPIAGSVAAWLQASIGNVGAGSLFAYLQSAAMAGYGAPIVNGICQACAVVSGTVATWWNFTKETKPPTPLKCPGPTAEED